jgi:hypothetical protein
MSTPAPPPRRRFKRRYIVGLLLLVMAGGTAACFHRPLNATEARLVGAWITTDSSETGYQFFLNRQCRYLDRTTGEPRASTPVFRNWLADSNKLTFRGLMVRPPGISQWSLLCSRLRSLIWSNPHARKLRLIDDDTIEVDGKVYVRIPTP